MDQAPKLPKRDELRIALWAAFYHGATPERFQQLVHEAAEALNEADRIESGLRLELARAVRE